MSSMNKVILIGRLGRDPETRYMPSGEAVCNFSLATSETWNDKKSGSKQERTEWHNISMFGRLAEIAGQYLRKGSLTYIEGRIQSRKYIDKTGVERTAYEIVANEMKMLGGKNEGGEDRAWDDESPAPKKSRAKKPAPVADDYDDYGHYEEDAPPPAAPKKRTERVAQAAKPVDDIDDDIPF